MKPNKKTEFTTKITKGTKGSDNSNNLNSDLRALRVLRGEKVFARASQKLTTEGARYFFIWNSKVTFTVSPRLNSTCCDAEPSASCQTSSEYFPAGTSASVNAPSARVTSK